ncbi:IclR family transcriptional regulator [Sphingomonas sp.]|uniref:IclR family transcriptional regulator n=1 Tax=Sphingomonas sp. TaxID=28214 RepID=UPI002ED8BF46
MTEPTPTPADRSGIQVIARAASILRALETEPAGLSLGDLATRLDLARSTVQRIVGALIDEGLLISAGPRSGVTLGPALTRLAAAAIIDTEQAVRPFLQEISRAIGETVDLSILQGGCAVFVDQVVGTSRLVAISAVGETFPLHCTANGKALLSRLPPERRDRILAARLTAYTANTLTNRAALDRDLDLAASTGIAWDIEEHTDGICAAGSAFVDPIGRSFALSVPVPTARFAAKREAIAETLADACTRLLAKIPGSSGGAIRNNRRD